jgi:hypothetical protein
MSEVDQRQALLDMAMGGRTEELQSALLQMLGAEGMDPMARTLLTQSLASPSVPATDDDDDDAEFEESLDRSERRRRAIRTLRRRFADLQDELDELRDRNERFAAALGACYRCWGKDRGCGLCGGTGRPGSRAPDRKSFDELVVPALRSARRANPPGPDRTLGHAGSKGGPA